MHRQIGGNNRGTQVSKTLNYKHLKFHDFGICFFAKMKNLNEATIG